MVKATADWSSTPVIRRFAPSLFQPLTASAISATAVTASTRRAVRFHFVSWVTLLHMGVNRPAAVTILAGSGGLNEGLDPVKPVGGIDTLRPALRVLTADFGDLDQNRPHKRGFVAAVPAPFRLRGQVGGVGSTDSLIS